MSAHLAKLPLLDVTDAAPHQEITSEQYARAYESHFNSTVRFLISKGVPFEPAQELAQAAWAHGWQTRRQLRDPIKVSTWVNSIGLNIYRNAARSQPPFRELPELWTTSKSALAAIDVNTILRRVRATDRQVLNRHYIEGYTVREIAQEQGRTEIAIRMGLLRARRNAGSGAMLATPARKCSNVSRAWRTGPPASGAAR